MPFKIKTSRENPINYVTDKAEVMIGETKFTLEEDNEGRLVITKYDYANGITDDRIYLNPGNSNQIKIK